MSIVAKKIAPETTLEYPCLMELKADSSLVVLFVSERAGTVVHLSKMYDIGYYDAQWAPSLFKPYTGEIVLSSK